MVGNVQQHARHSRRGGARAVSRRVGANVCRTAMQIMCGTMNGSVCRREIADGTQRATTKRRAVGTNASCYERFTEIPWRNRGVESRCDRSTVGAEPGGSGAPFVCTGNAVETVSGKELADTQAKHICGRIRTVRRVPATQRHSRLILFTQWMDRCAEAPVTGIAGRTARCTLGTQPTQLTEGPQ